MLVECWKSAGQVLEKHYLSERCTRQALHKQQRNNRVVLEEYTYIQSDDAGVAQIIHQHVWAFLRNDFDRPRVQIWASLDNVDESRRPLQSYKRGEST